jgi:hypothetical protein
MFANESPRRLGHEAGAGQPRRCGESLDERTGEAGGVMTAMNRQATPWVLTTRQQGGRRGNSPLDYRSGDV